MKDKCKSDDLLNQAMNRCGKPAGHPTQVLGNHAAITAYGLAVAAGFRGTVREWLDSLRGEPGQPGQQGRPGRGFEVQGYFETLEEMLAQITEPQAGDAYGVGDGEDAVVYVWDGIGEEWHNIGTLRGPKGDTGETGYCPKITAKRVDSALPVHYKGVQITTVNKDPETGMEIGEISYVEDGRNGSNGLTPHMAVTDIPGGHRVTISYNSPGVEIPDIVFDVMDGEQGYPGGAVIYITDEPDEAGGTVRTITAVDISNDTVSADVLQQGYTAHNALGQPIVGEATVGAITPATTSTLGGIIVGSDLLVDVNGVLSVDKATAVAQDNTKPITAAAVYTEVGNINALLETI